MTLTCRWVSLFLLCAGALACAGPAAALEDRIVSISKDDAALVAAYAKARAGLDEFLALLDKPPAGVDAFAVKLGVVDTENGGHEVVRSGHQSAEFIWVKAIKRDGAGFTGVVNNQLGFVRNIRLGETVRFVRDDISDWMYRRNGQIKGNATACPLIASMSENERQPYRKRLPDCF